MVTVFLLSPEFRLLVPEHPPSPRLWAGKLPTNYFKFLLAAASTVTVCTPSSSKPPAPSWRHMFYPSEVITALFYQNGKKTGASQTVITPTSTASGAPILTKSMKLYSPGPWTMRFVWYEGGVTAAPIVPVIKAMANGMKLTSS